ncbi:MAG: NAD(P)/FAD-dependent oxidoreductase [Proteobacteria bacterium]|nr:NAD(P)/FAD-dependent oxidoreductase [Pseudomonadota bacterium]
MKKDSATILGGGLCGSLLSVMLARRGIKVTLLERRADPRTDTTEVGRSINLVLSARGIRALKYAGVFNQVESLLMPMQGRLIHDEAGKTELHPYGQKESEVIYSVSRAELNRKLIECADAANNVNIRFRHEAVSYYPGEAILRVRDHLKGSDYDLKARPLIAADGAGSRVRRAFSNTDTLVGTEELLGHSYKELAIPNGPEGDFLLTPDALHIWPRGGFMLIALPNPGGDFTLTLFFPAEGDPSFASLDSDQKVADFFNEHFSDAVPLIDDLIGSWNRNPVGILGTVRCKHWHDDRNLLLIGDAAHAVVPFHGQGMNLAFEDCVILDQVCDNRDVDWETAFKVFEAEQIANANAIADMALENYIEMRDTVRDPKYLLRKNLSFELERRLPNRFIPRYSMVMFHDEIPYAVAKERGAVQQRLLKELTRDVDSIEDIDIDTAARLVERRLPPVH